MYLINYEKNNPLGVVCKDNDDPFDAFGHYTRSRTFDATVASHDEDYPCSLSNFGSGIFAIESLSSESTSTKESVKKEPRTNEDYRGSSNYHLGFIPKGRVAYTFPLASRVKCTCLLKVVVSHTVAGLYIGKSGAHLKRLQGMLNFKMTQSGRGTKGDFTGVGYPCHRTNTTLLFEGQLVDILMAFRPLYRIIQNDVLVFDEESLQHTGGRLLNIKFEFNVILPAERKCLLLQDSGRRCNMLRQLSGVDIIAGKQNFEHKNIKETIVTLHGFDENVEKACEWLGIFLQDSPAIASGDYSFMDYPKYTLAIPKGSIS